jgi:uncharacterized SAM-binding protein YcdF (DUF218 family)
MTAPKQTLLRALLASALLLVMVAAAAWGLRRVGQWLVVEDLLEPAQAIVVLSGRVPARAFEAAQLYRQGYAAQVWVLRPASPAEELQRFGIDYVGEDFYNQKILMRLGVPADAIRVLEKPIRNTEEEVQEIAEQLRAVRGRKVIVITSPPHTRRVKAIWRTRVGDTPQLLVRAASQEPYDRAHWWRHTQDALDVVRELLGLANVWTGFPVRPEER